MVYQKYCLVNEMKMFGEKLHGMWYFTRFILCNCLSCGRLGGMQQYSIHLASSVISGMLGGDGGDALFDYIFICMLC